MQRLVPRTAACTEFPVLVMLALILRWESFPWKRKVHVFVNYDQNKRIGAKKDIQLKVVFLLSGPPLEKPFPSEGLLVAAKLGHAQIIQHMIEAGADIDTISLFKGKNLWIRGMLQRLCLLDN